MIDARRVLCGVMLGGAPSQGSWLRVLVLLAFGCTPEVTSPIPNALVRPAQSAEQRVPSPAVQAAVAVTTSSPAPAAQSPRPAVPAATAPIVPPPASAQIVDAQTPDPCALAIDDVAAFEGVRTDDPRLRRGALVVVRKAARRLVLFDEGQPMLCLRVALGFAPTGHKQIQGDGRTPEGWYRLSDKPWSSFDNAIAINYPNAIDAVAAAADGRIRGGTRDRILADLKAGRMPPQSTSLGGAVLIHGGGSVQDWTLGCVALDDTDLLALRRALPTGMRANLLVVP